MSRNRRLEHRLERRPRAAARTEEAVTLFSVDGVLHDLYEEPSAASRSRAPREEREPPRILVVDDDPQTLRYVRQALVPAGYDPVVTGACWRSTRDGC